MLQFGIYTPQQFDVLGFKRRLMGSRISYSLLDIGDDPSPGDILRFEDVCFTMRFSNGTFRTSFRKRFTEIDDRVGDLLSRLYGNDEPLLFEDRAASHALTAFEWAQNLLTRFPRARFEASDLMLRLVRLHLPGGCSYICEPDGTALQVIDPPFVLPIYHRGRRNLPINQLLAKRYKRRFDLLQLPEGWVEAGSTELYTVQPISLIHPEARTFERHEPRFRVLRRSVFDRSGSPCHALRTMNILNRSYFNEIQLREAVKIAFTNVVPGGIWIVGRTTEDTFKNHGSILRRGERQWEIVERFGNGSEIENLAMEVSQ